MNLKHLLFVALMQFFSGAIAQPIFEWSSKLSAPGLERVKDQIVDENGNTYTVGEFVGTVDFDPSANVYNLTAFGSADFNQH